LKEFTFNIDWQFIIKCLAAATLMSLVVWGIHPQGTAATVLTIITGAFVYVSILIVLKGLWKKEWYFLKSLRQG
jgi:hypothetical protein